MRSVTASHQEVDPGDLGWVPQSTKPRPTSVDRQDPRGGLATAPTSFKPGPVSSSQSTKPRYQRSASSAVIA